MNGNEGKVKRRRPKRTSQSARHSARSSCPCVPAVRAALRSHSRAHFCVGVSVGISTGLLIESRVRCADEIEGAPDVTRTPQSSANVSPNSAQHPR